MIAPKLLYIEDLIALRDLLPKVEGECWLELLLRAENTKAISFVEAADTSAKLSSQELARYVWDRADGKQFKEEFLQ